jgi:hypothetical protein
VVGSVCFYGTGFGEDWADVSAEVWGVGLDDDGAGCCDVAGG